MTKHEDPSEKLTTANDEPMPTITLFVYGTLKRGHWNHDRFCRNAIEIQPATTVGRIYNLPAGYPALEVPASAILAHGTTDPLADAATQARLAATFAPRTPQRPSSAPQCACPGDWNLIHGELITFPNPVRDLPPIDRLEGFRPGSDSFYLRVLVWVWVQSKPQSAWIYVGSSVLDGLKSPFAGRAQLS